MAGSLERVAARLPVKAVRVAAAVNGAELPQCGGLMVVLMVVSAVVVTAMVAEVATA